MGGDKWIIRALPVEGITFQLINWTPWKLFKVLVSIIGSPEIVLICMIAFPINEQKVIYSHCKKKKKPDNPWKGKNLPYFHPLLQICWHAFIQYILEHRYVSVFFLYFLPSISYWSFPFCLYFPRLPLDMAIKPETGKVATPEYWVHLWQEHSTPRVKAVFTLLI